MMRDFIKNGTIGDAYGDALIRSATAAAAKPKR